MPPITNDCDQLLPLREEELARAALEFPLSGSWEWDSDPAFDPDSPEGQTQWEAACRNGQLTLVQDPGEGGQTWFLVTNGPFRGEVWERDEGGVLRLPGVTFLDWLDLHLNKKLTSYTDQLFRLEKEARRLRDPLPAIRGLMAAKKRREIQWDPPVPLEEVQAFEARHNVTLPEEYVTFVTQIAGGCRRFPTHGKEGGTLFSLAELDAIPGMDQPFPFQEENTETFRMDLFRAYNPAGFGEHFKKARQEGKFYELSLWRSRFGDLPRPEPLHPVWASPDYSVLRGVLPFANYHDAQNFGNIPHVGTTAFLVLNGPSRGQVWTANVWSVVPAVPEYHVKENFFQWAISMLENGAL